MKKFKTLPPWSKNDFFPIMILIAIPISMLLSCKKEISSGGATPTQNGSPANRSPVAFAGQHHVLVLPTDSVLLDGASSYDPDGKISQYQWTKVLGPAAFHIAYPDSAKTIVRGMVEGIYTYQLTVTDDKGANTKDTVQITVQKQPSVSFVGIYISGNENGEACYWKNGLKQKLNISSSGYHINTSIAVSGSDVYVAGGEVPDVFPDGPTTAKYWKNGSEVVLGKELYSSANSIAVVNNDVYVAGSEAKLWNSSVVAKYWKNGQAVSLTNGSKNASANSIVVVGGNVYVAGREGNVAKYWKNGQAISLTNGATDATASSIVVVGEDVYVAGREGNVAKYWKNGQAVSLTNGLYEAYASSITVVGNDVYIAGQEAYEIAKYWKNGLSVSLDYDYGYASSICVKNNDVYVAGTGSSSSVAPSPYIGKTGKPKRWQ